MHKVFAHTLATAITEVRSAPDSDGSQTAGGPSLSTTAKVLSIPIGADWLSITPRNFVGCGTIRFLLNQWLTIIRTTDSLTSKSNANNHSVELQDGDTTDVQFDAQSTAANGDYIYVGAALPFRGCAIRVGSDPQNTASVLTVRYWNGTWTSAAVTDGTSSGGASMAQHGNATWTVPSTWRRASLNAIGDVSLTGDCADQVWACASLYWTRWEFSATTEATWNLSQWRSLNRSIAYSELIEGQPFECAVDTRLIGCVEALTDAGTANVIVNAGVLETSVTGRAEEFA